MAKINWMTPEDLKNNMKEGISEAKEAFEFGINNPRRDPIQAAVEAIKAGIWAKNTKAAFSKWAANLGKITLEQWKSAAMSAAATYADRAASVGANNWTAYYEKAKPIIEDTVTEFLKAGDTRESRIKMWESLHKLSEI